MTFGRTAPHGAIAQSTCPKNANGGVLFQPRGEVGPGASHHGRGSGWLSRLGGAAWLGAWLTASSIGAGLAPAAAAEGSGAADREETAAARIEVAFLPPERGPARPGAEKSPDEPRLAASVDAPHPSPRLPREDLVWSNLAENLDVGGVKVPRSLVETVIRAAEAAEVDPVYMLALADKESNFSAEAKAATSSAEGLFQFVKATWLEMMRSHGAKHGYEAAAAAVETVKGELTIADDVMREWVLGLRRDAHLSTVMAAEMLKRDRAKVERRIGRDLSRSEFYLVHFLGAASAGKLMEIVSGRPQQSAPAAFPHAAKANKSLFFTRDGRKTRHLTVAEFYNRLDRMIDTRLDRYLAVPDVFAMMRAPL